MTKQAAAPTFLYSKETYIAFVTLFLICLHLIFRYLLSLSEFYQNLPLYIALVFGGIPIVFELLMKAIKLEFSSDLLAGISIVTAIFLGQY
jgi:hypothetical protein